MFQLISCDLSFRGCVCVVCCCFGGFWCVFCFGFVLLVCLFACFASAFPNTSNPSISVRSKIVRCHPPWPQLFMQYTTWNKALDNLFILTNHHLIVSGILGPWHHSSPAPVTQLGCVHHKNRWDRMLLWECGMRQSLLDTNGILLTMALLLWVLFKYPCIL